MSIVECNSILTYGCLIPRTQLLPTVEVLIPTEENPCDMVELETQLLHGETQLLHGETLTFEWVKDSTGICAIYLYVSATTTGSVDYGYTDEFGDLRHLSGPVEMEYFHELRDQLLRVTRYLTSALIQPKMHTLSWASS